MNCWSDDGRFIAFSVLRKDSLQSKPDTTVVVSTILVQQINSDTGHVIGTGYLLDWSQDGKYMLYSSEGIVKKPKCFFASIDSLDKPLKTFESNNILFTYDSQNILYIDDSLGVWNFSILSGKETLLFRLPKVYTESWFLRGWPNENSMAIVTNNFEKEYISITRCSKSGSGFKELLRIPGWSGGFSYCMSTKILAISRIETRNKIVVIDNFR
jgi:hypothetical protein